MAYQLPGIGDFKSQYPQRDFPFAVPLYLKGGSGAAISLTTGGPNNSIATAVVTAAGTGYKSKPTIIVMWGKGTGARLEPVLTTQTLTGVTVADPGYGYTDPSTFSVYISSGAGDNSDLTKVTDYDIARALRQAISFNMSQALWGSQSAYTMAYCMLAAHYLCENAQNSGAGLAGQAEWARNSKTVGDVTDSFSIPDRVLRSPFLSKISKTTYGAQFLEVVSPNLVGNFQSYHRCTLP